MKIERDESLALSDAYILRNATQDDWPGLTDLIIAADFAESGESDYSQDELITDWQRPGFDPAQDAWVVVEAHSGQISGYEEVWNRAGHARLQGDGYVHPEHLNKGIGTALLRAAERRARQHISLAPAGTRVSLRNGVYGSDQAAHRLHENEGYLPIRYFWRMEIALDGPAPEPQWPEGLFIRTFIPGQDDRPVFEAFDEAFRDGWGHTPWDFDWWRKSHIEQDWFDPSLWFLALEGGSAGSAGSAGFAGFAMQIAGGALCKPKGAEGWVSQLAVRRPWRRRGLGLALLRHAFNEFFRRGVRKIGLGVDASNPTGATRLYERAGMQVAHEYILYEKELRPGVEIFEAEGDITGG
jgi:mycothiol synthase